MSFFFLDWLLSSLSCVFWSYSRSYYSSVSTSVSDFCMEPLSFLRLSRHKRALFRFLRRRYSSGGKYLRMEINVALLTVSILNRKSPTFTISGFLGSFLFLFFAVAVSSFSGMCVTPSGKSFKKSADMRAFCTLFLFLRLSEELIDFLRALPLALLFFAWGAVVTIIYYCCSEEAIGRLASWLDE